MNFHVSIGRLINMDMVKVFESNRFKIEQDLFIMNDLVL